jgi:hypothetical protein
MIDFLLLGGFVGEHEAGQRLFQVAHDPRCSKSGVYWSWNGGPREGRGTEAIEKGGQISGGGGAGGGWDSIFENDQSAKVLDVETQLKLFQYSTEITGAKWPELKAITSPCPTLKVIGAVTKGMVKREELKRMQEMGRPGLEDGLLQREMAEQQAAEAAAAAAILVVKKPKLSKRKKVAIVADKVVSTALSQTVGRVARFAGKRVLGEIPETAKTGSFDDEDAAAASQASEGDVQELLEEVKQQLNSETVICAEDEALFQQIYDNERSTNIVSLEESPTVSVPSKISNSTAVIA